MQKTVIGLAALAFAAIGPSFAFADDRGDDGRGDEGRPAGCSVPGTLVSHIQSKLRPRREISVTSTASISRRSASVLRS
jgi:hypothetical protein